MKVRAINNTNPDKKVSGVYSALFHNPLIIRCIRNTQTADRMTPQTMLLNENSKSLNSVNMCVYIYKCALFMIYTKVVIMN